MAWPSRIGAPGRVTRWPFGEPFPIRPRSSSLLLRWADEGEVDVILTTGGTGFGPRDVTPEATRAILDRVSVGLAEAVRRTGEKATPYSALSRGIVGARGRVFVANLPGSPGGVRDGLGVLGPLVRHLSELLREVDTTHRPS